MRPTEAQQEVPKSDILVVVVPDGQFLAGGGNAAFGIQPRREDPEVDVGQKRAQHQDAIARLDIVPDFLAAHGSFIDAQVERVLLADHRLAQQRGGHRNARLLGQPQ